MYLLATVYTHTGYTDQDMQPKGVSGMYNNQNVRTELFPEPEPDGQTQYHQYSDGNTHQPSSQHPGQHDNWRGSQQQKIHPSYQGPPQPPSGHPGSHHQEQRGQQPPVLIPNVATQRQAQGDVQTAQQPHSSVYQIPTSQQMQQQPPVAQFSPLEQVHHQIQKHEQYLQGLQQVVSQMLWQQQYQQLLPVQQQMQQELLKLQELQQIQQQLQQFPQKQHPVLQPNSQQQHLAEQSAGSPQHEAQQGTKHETQWGTTYRAQQPSSTTEQSQIPLQQQASRPEQSSQCTPTSEAHVRDVQYQMEHKLTMQDHHVSTDPNVGSSSHEATGETQQRHSYTEHAQIDILKDGLKLLEEKKQVMEQLCKLQEQIDNQSSQGEALQVKGKKLSEVSYSQEESQEYSHQEVSSVICQHDEVSQQELVYARQSSDAVFHDNTKSLSITCKSSSYVNVCKLFSSEFIPKTDNILPIMNSSLLQSVIGFRQIFA